MACTQPDPRIKKIKIQTGVVKRITKEKDMYEKEALQIEAKIEKMQTDGTDAYVLRKQQEVLQESKMMGPDTLKRLRSAYEELSRLVEGESELAETEEYKAAKVALDAAKPLVEA
ncbi:tubulin-specific chaperone A-like [Littorina saxatilis]|uniref:Tubulin-specific chaperone A n=1 Tax=Littorina saxatilis TaxID=31220 RepID=A0AAN9GQ86_9CAEN